MLCLLILKFILKQCIYFLLHRIRYIYYPNTDAIIYVVDSADKSRMGICKQQLVSMLEVTLTFNLKSNVP